MFVSVKFQLRDSRTYTYSYDGAQPLRPGDMVKVDCQTESKTVSVVAVDVPKPPFACKPIIAVLAKGEL